MYKQIVVPQSDSNTLAGQFYKVECCNWAKQFPQVANVSVQLAYSGDVLHVLYSVEEPDTLGVVEFDNGPVWTDSCVELFLAVDDLGYYNIECTCTGKLLIGFGQGRENRSLAPKDVLNSVVRRPSLGSGVVGLIHNKSWSVELEIPTSALFKHQISTWSGVEGRCNIYKCGNNLPKKHFLSLAPIDTPTPDFHRPEFFIPLRFAK